VSEWGLICEEAWKQQAVNSGFFAGFLVGAGLFGTLSDTLGENLIGSFSPLRRHAGPHLRVTCRVLVTMCALTCGGLVTIPLYDECALLLTCELSDIYLCIVTNSPIQICVCVWLCVAVNVN
jgi:hypothetical protein